MSNSGAMKFEKPSVKECTLSDDELVDKVDEWVTKLCASRGNAWCLSVPVDFNHDPDMLILELVKRFNKKRKKLF